jgi:hypothetical protein
MRWKRTTVTGMGSPHPDQIREITERLGDIAQRIQVADAEKKEPLYEALGIVFTYDNATRTATVRSRPSLPYRYSWCWCPRAELTTTDTLVIAQGRLGLRPTDSTGKPLFAPSPSSTWAA